MERTQKNTRRRVRTQNLDIQDAGSRPWMQVPEAMEIETPRDRATGVLLFLIPCPRSKYASVICGLTAVVITAVSACVRVARGST